MNHDFTLLRARTAPGVAERFPIIRCMAFANVRKVAEADFPTRWGHFRIFGFAGERDDETRSRAAKPCRRRMDSRKKLSRW